MQQQTEQRQSLQATVTPRPRDVMPETWRKIGELRDKWGKEHVADCIRRGMAGEADCFWACEGGHVVGTPFCADKELAQLLGLAVALGSRYAVVMRPPAAMAAAAAAGAV